MQAIPNYSRPFYHRHSGAPHHCGGGRDRGKGVILIKNYEKCFKKNIDCYFGHRRRSGAVGAD